MIRLSSIKNRLALMPQNGFTLVELIVTVVLVGIIGTFTTLFVYTGLNGYLQAKDTSEGALMAQIALDRISIELRDIDAISTFAADNRIDYTSKTLSGARQITYNAVTDTIFLDVDGANYDLLDRVPVFNMTITAADLNNSGDGNNEVQAINISFTVTQIGRQFSARIFPRNMVPAPP